MKHYSAALLSAISSRDWQARYVIAVHTDDVTVYFASHDDITTPDPDNTIVSKVKKLSSTTQKNTPDQRISSIGSQTFVLANKDNAISSWLRSLNDGEQSLYEKKAQFWIGAVGLDFDDYAPQPPQYITKIKHGLKSYTFTCQDALRFVKSSIFTTVSTELTADLTEDEESSISVTTTEDMPGLVEHGSSYSDGTADSSVGYLYLEGEDENDNSIYEVITFTGMGSTGFTGLTRGALGTRAYEWESGTEISSHLYLEMPVPKLIYSLLTGNLYGQTGETLPSDWSNEIDESLVDLASFENIGTNLWDPEDDSAGIILRLDGLEDEDAKTIIETQLLPLINCSLVVNANGELALKETTAVVTDSVADYVLNESNVISVGDFENDLDNIVNRYLIKYSYRRDQGDYSRYHLLEDYTSQAKYGATDIEEYSFKGLHYSRHSLDTIRSYLTGLRDRLSAEQSTVTITSILNTSVLDVADIARVKLTNWEDYTSTGAVNRSFEVQQVQIDWLNARVKLSLSGTIQKAAPLSLVSDSVDSSIDHTNWTEFTSVLADGTYMESAGTLTITGDNDLTGFESLDDNGWYYDDGNGDVIISSGVLVTCTNNFILDAGTLTVNGDLDLSGRGLPGLNTYDASEVLDSEFGAVSGPDTRANEVRITSDYCWYCNENGQWGNFVTEERQSELTTKALSNYAPSIGSDGILTGLPPTLCGRPGLQGKPIELTHSFYFENTFVGTRTWLYGSVTESVASGGGVLLIVNALYGEGIGRIITNGADGISGDLVNFYTEENIEFVSENVNYDYDYPGHNITSDTGDLSDLTDYILGHVRDPGGSNFSNDYFDFNLYAMGSEGGWPGGVLVILKGDELAPNLGTLVTSNIGVANYHGEQLEVGEKTFYEWPWTYDHTLDLTEYSGGYSDTSKELSSGYEVPSSEATKVCYLTSSEGDDEQIGDTISQYALPVDSLTLSEALDTPSTPNQNISTITATAAEPDDENFSYAIIEYRIKDSGSPFTQIPYKTPTQATVELASDGTEYEFRARSVSSLGLESTSGVSETITTKLVTLSTGADVDTSDEFKLPNVSGLSLVNRTSGSATQFKSGNAEFTWDSLASELNFKSYTVKVYRVESDDSTTLLRTAETEDSNYTYTLEQNVTDNCGRKLQISVTATSRTGYITSATSLQVENPEPSAPSNVVITASYTSVGVTFDLPTDADFVGVDAYILAGTDGDVYQEASTRLTGNNFSITDGVSPNTSYLIGLKSVDEFGAGGAITQTQVTTPAVPGVDLSGLGDWAWLTEQADLDFITQAIANSAISGDKVTSLTVAKLTAGQITVQMDLGTGVLLDGQNGIIQTVASSGYKATMGTHTVDGIENTLVYSVTNASNDCPIWQDVNGNAAFGLLGLSSDGSISSPYFNLSESGLSLTGAITITSGSGYSNLTDKPTSLAGINSSEGSKLTGIEEGAQTNPVATAITSLTWHWPLSDDPTREVIAGLEDSHQSSSTQDSIVDNGPFGKSLSMTSDGLSGLWLADYDTIKSYDPDDGSGEWTWEILFKPESETLTDAAARVISRDASDCWYIFYDQENKHFGASIVGIGATSQSNGAAPESQWYHLVLVKNSSGYSFYVNGVLIGTKPGSASYSLNDRGVALGCNSEAAATGNWDTNEALGQYGYVKFYSNSLSKNEVEALAIAGLNSLSGSTADNTSEILTTKGIEDGATKNTGALADEDEADWNSTLKNIPIRLSNSATTGLNLTATYLGYYNGADWQTYIDSNGNFHFGATQNNYLDYNGNVLVIATDNLQVNADGSATFSGDLVSASYATAESGERIEINVDGSNTLEVFNSEGSSVFTLDAEAAYLTQPVTVAAWRDSTLITSYSNATFSLGSGGARESTGVYSLYLPGNFDYIVNPERYFNFEIECHSSGTGSLIPQAVVADVSYDYSIRLTVATIEVRKTNVSSHPATIGSDLIDPEYLFIKAYKSGYTP